MTAIPKFFIQAQPSCLCELDKLTSATSLGNDRNEKLITHRRGQKVLHYSLKNINKEIVATSSF